MRRVTLAACLVEAAALLLGCNSVVGPVAQTPLAEPIEPVSFDSVAFADDGMSVRVNFIGGREFKADDPCTVAYVGRARAVDDELEIGIFPQKHPVQLPDVVACDGAGHPRALVIELDKPYRGTRIRDLAGYVMLLAPPPGLVTITGLPEGWELRREESLPESPTGRWSRTYSPITNPGNQDSWVQLIQAIGGPVDTTGGDLQPDVMVNGVRATSYLHAPSGEMVLVWQIGKDGVALTGNLRDFSQDQFRRLAESIIPAK